MRELRDEEGEGGCVRVRIRKNENGESLEDIYTSGLGWVCIIPKPVSGFFFFFFCLLKPKPASFA